MNLQVVRALVALWAAMAASTTFATDLGTAGPFRSFGGAVCSPADAAKDCGAPAVDASAPPSQQAATQIDRALRFIDVLQMAEAREALVAATRLDPSNLRARTLLARLDMTMGNAVAESEVNAALVVAPHDAGLLAAKAALACDQCNPQQTLKDILAAVELKPDDPDIRFLRSQLYVRWHQDALAFTDLSYALAVEPSYARARQARAEVALRLQNYPAAIVDTDALLAQAPHDRIALGTRAEAHARLGDDAAALRDYDQILPKSNPMTASLLKIPMFRDDAIKRAGVLVRLKQNAEAMAAIDDILAQGGRTGLLRIQVYLRNNGFPNVEITGQRSDAFDTAVRGCFADTTCGPQLAR